MIIQLGRDGLKKPTKKRKTKRPASKTISAVSGAPETTNYMRTIQTPTIPTLVTGISIRSQADLQEQLRIKQTTEREDVKLYPTPAPAPATFKRRLEDEELVQQELLPAPAEEAKQAEEPEPPMTDFPKMPVMRITPASLGSIAEQGEFRGYFSREDPDITPTPTPPKTTPLRPPARGRPRADEKTVDELKAEIRASGKAPAGFSSKRKDALKEIARELGIDIMR